MRTFLLGVLALLYLLHPLPAAAQTNSEVNAGIQFDFSLPGARSLALGGAFVAVADDATSVWANPAGLTNLSRPEVSAEGRFWDFNNLVANHGHDGVATNIGVDTISGVVDTGSNSYAGALSFLSLALPHDRWTLGFFRHQVSSFTADIESDGVFLDRPYTDRVEPFRGSMKLDISAYGASVGARVSNSFTVGGTAALYRFKMNAKTSRFYYAPFTGDLPFPYPANRRQEFVDSGEYFGAANFTAPNEFLTVTEQGTDYKLGFNLGGLYRTSTWSAGAAYRFAPKFHYDVTTVIPTAFVPASFDPTDTGAPFFSLFKGQIFDQEQATFDLPDTLALGFTVRPQQTLVVSFEYDRVWYSQISDNNVEVFGIEEHDVNQGKTIADQIRAGLVFPDVNQIRAGVEYVMVRPGPDVAIRFGAWLDPDHRMHFDGSFPKIKTLFRSGNDAFHVAPGVGFTFDRFQIDAALDVSSRINTLSVSTVYRF